MQRASEQKKSCCESKDMIVVRVEHLQKGIHDYDSSRWFFEKYLSAEPAEIKKIKDIAKKYANKSQDVLASDDFYDFVNSVRVSTLSLMTKFFRHLIEDENFYLLVSLLEKNGLNTKESCVAIAKLNAESRKKCVRLLSDTHSRFPSMVLLLVKNNALDDNTIKLIEIGVDVRRNTNFFMSMNGKKLLPILIENQLLDNYLLDDLSAVAEAKGFFENVVYFQQKELLNRQNFYMLLDNTFEDPQLHYRLSKIFQCLDKNTTLNDDTIFYCIEQNKNHEFCEIIEILSAARVLSDSTIDAIPSDTKSFSAVLHLLNTFGLLSRATYFATVRFFESYPNDKKNLINLLKSIELSSISLAEKHYLITLSERKRLFFLSEMMHLVFSYKLSLDGVLDKLFSLSDNAQSELIVLMQRLYLKNQLDQTSLTGIINLLAHKLIKPAEDSVTKLGRKRSGEHRSKFVINDELHVYIEHQRREKDEWLDDRYKKGGCGLIKKGYTALEEKTPRFMIKKFFKSSDVTHARREVMYHRLQGKTSYFFQYANRYGQNKVYLVAPWVKGKDLASLTTQEILSISLKNRVKMMMMLLSELNHFHCFYRVHGDIKPANVIVDIDGNSMHLIDFGASRKRYVKTTLCTAAYLPPDATNDYQFSFDVYAMGIVAASCFPEFFVVVTEDDITTIKHQKSTQASCQEWGVRTLVDAMIVRNHEKRCIVKDALNYASQLHDAFDHLSIKIIDEITTSTIHHAGVTMEDSIYRGSKTLQARYYDRRMS